VIVTDVERQILENQLALLLHAAGLLDGRIDKRASDERTMIRRRIAETQRALSS
jgi:hypothetical protein